MSNAAGSHQITEAIRQRLMEHEYRLQDPQRAFEVYRDLLSDEERKAIGPLESFYSHATDRTIGMWMRVKRVSRNRAIIELARLHGMPEGSYLAMLRGIGEDQSSSQDRLNGPYWDRQTLELFLDGHLIKRINGKARNQLPILDVFQEDRWPGRIDDPLDPSDNNRRLTDALKRLNERLLSIRFSRDGTGTGIRWQRVSTLD